MRRGDKNSRNSKDADLALMLAAGESIADAAQLCDVSVATVYRRLKQPGFREQVQEMRSVMVGRAVGRLADYAAGAAETLDELRRLPRVGDSVKLGACRAILELGTKLRESEELERRIRDLEQLLKQGPAAPGGEQGDRAEP